VSFWRVGLKGTERSSGYVWKNRGANVVPKNAPICQPSSIERRRRAIESSDICVKRHRLKQGGRVEYQIQR